MFVCHSDSQIKLNSFLVSDYTRSVTVARSVINESAHDYNKNCATSEDSDQPVPLCSLIRGFADHMCLLQPPGYSKRNKL